MSSSGRPIRILIIVAAVFAARAPAQPTSAGSAEPRNVTLGVAIGPCASREETSDPDGICILSVRPDGAADRAGVREGDVLRRIGDTRIAGGEEVVATLRRFEVGDRTTIVVEREGTEATLAIEFAPEDAGALPSAAAIALLAPPTQGPPAIEVLERSWTEAELRQRLAAANAELFAEGDVLTLTFESEADDVHMCCAISSPMRRVEGSDLWVLDVRVRDLERAVLSYGFREIPTQGSQSYTGIAGVWRGAEAPDPAPRTSRLRGEIRRHTLDSEALGESRGLTVYVPPSGDTSGPTPVVYAADGQSVELLAEFLEPMIERGNVPPVLLVGVDSSERRAEEYLPKVSSDVFLAHERFFVEEVAEWAERELGAARDRERRAVFGYSNGGAFAVAMGYRHADRFAHVIAFSVGVPSPPSEGDLPEFYLVAGTLEAGFHGATSALANALQEAGASAAFRERVSGHDLFMWAEELPAAVRWAFQAK